MPTALLATAATATLLWSDAPPATTHCDEQGAAQGDQQAGFSVRADMSVQDLASAVRLLDEQRSDV